MNKKKIISLLATFITGLSLAPAPRTMAYKFPNWIDNVYNDQKKEWKYFAETGSVLVGKDKSLFENKDNVTVTNLKIKREGNRGPVESGMFKFSYDNYYVYVEGFKKYLFERSLQISEEGFLLNNNLNFVDLDGNEVKIGDDLATVYKVNVDLPEFAESSDNRMIRDKLQSLEDLLSYEVEDNVMGGWYRHDRNIYRVNDDNGFYLAYEENGQTYILKNSEDKMESVALNELPVNPENKNDFTFVSDYLRYKFPSGEGQIVNNVKAKFTANNLPILQQVVVQEELPNVNNDQQLQEDILQQIPLNYQQNNNQPHVNVLQQNHPNYQQNNNQPHVNVLQQNHPNYQQNDHQPQGNVLQQNPPGEGDNPPGQTNMSLLKKAAIATGVLAGGSGAGYLIKKYTESQYDDLEDDETTLDEDEETDVDLFFNIRE